MAQPGSSGGGTAGAFDLDAPEFTPPDCPAWARESLPEWVRPYVGLNGTPARWWPAKRLFGSAVRGLDRYQANHFIFHCRETAGYLYGNYTPLAVGYRTGALPSYERLAGRLCAGCAGDEARAVALVKAVPTLLRHPTMPPLGPPVAPDRNLGDGALLATGCGFCNEQARVFIRLCQVLGIPARMVHLLGQGHTVAEFHAGGRWVLADASNAFVAAGSDGGLLSAAQCHDRGEGQRAYAKAKERRLRELAELPDSELGRDAASAARCREAYRRPLAAELAGQELAFGVINYPLPR